MFSTALGNYRLQRLPSRKKELLQAWNAADELLLNTLHADHAETLTTLEHSQAPTLLVNDRFGALAVALHRLQLHCWNDSFIAHQAIANNIALNVESTTPPLTSLRSTDALPCSYDLVLIKLPKSNTLLAQQLKVLSRHIHNNTLIIAAGMAKNIHRSTLALFEQYLGKTRTSLATKKARLVYCQTDNTEQHAEHDDTEELGASHYYCEPLDIDLINYANVFSQQRMDIGARAMIEAIRLKAPEQAANICDLGCGNGILGLFAARWLDQRQQQLQPQQQTSAQQQRSVTFIDESYMAVHSASHNCQQFQAKHGAFFAAAFFAADSLTADSSATDSRSNTKPGEFDWVLCNPPFHSDNEIGNFIANRMFEHSFGALQPGGQLWVVANRHLPHYKIIQHIFCNHSVVYSNKKFVVVSAIKR